MSIMCKDVIFWTYCMNCKASFEGECPHYQAHKPAESESPESVKGDNCSECKKYGAESDCNDCEGRSL